MHHSRHQRHTPGFRGTSSGERDFGRQRQHFRGGGRGGPRARRGDIRTAVLALLAEQPMHGYEMIKEIGERTGDLWQPSPGSIYPTLQLLEEVGLIQGTEEDGKRRYTLTAEGREAVAHHSGPLPWDKFTANAKSGHARLFEASRQLGAAVHQAALVGSEDQRARVRDLLEEGRRAIYAILAEKAPDPEEEGSTQGGASSQG